MIRIWIRTGEVVAFFGRHTSIDSLCSTGINAWAMMHAFLRSDTRTRTNTCCSRSPVVVSVVLGAFPSRNAGADDTSALSGMAMVVVLPELRSFYRGMTACAGDVGLCHWVCGGASVAMGLECVTSMVSSGRILLLVVAMVAVFVGVARWTC